MDVHGQTESYFVSAGLKGGLPKGWQVISRVAHAKASAELADTNFYLDYPDIDAALESSGPATALNILGDGSHTARYRHGWLAHRP